MNRDDLKINKASVEKFYPKRNIDMLGYESPITVVMGQRRFDCDDMIYKATQEIGIDIDKEELFKALRYDRDQYEKGFTEGYNRKADEVAREIFEEIENNSYKYGVNFLISEETLAELKKKYESEKDK